MDVRHAPCIRGGMDSQTRYVSVLARAEEILGGRARMAAFLGVAGARLDAWLDGEEPAPLEVFLRSLDVIADGPYAPRGRKVRVAVIDQR
jgi:hypothetical protein